MGKEQVIKLVLDQSVLDRYNKYYFKQHPRAKKVPIEHPYHPSINTWCILPRIQMNALKQKWKDMICWWIRDLGYQDLHLDSFSIIQTVYYSTKIRHDPDNTVGKFVYDGFTEAGFIVDDDEKHLHSLTLKTGYDKENPRTEFEIKVSQAYIKHTCSMA